MDEDAQIAVIHNCARQVLVERYRLRGGTKGSVAEPGRTVRAV